MGIGTRNFRVFVVLSTLLTIANASLGFNYDELIFRPTGETGAGNSLFVVSSASLLFAGILLLHVTLFFFWNPARFIFGLLILAWIPATFIGALPGMPAAMDSVYLGTMVTSALVSGAVFGLSFTGPIGRRFQGVPEDGGA